MSTLFSEFDKVTPEFWKQKIQVDLKGADYNETLLTTTEEGIVIKPFYSEEDRINLDIQFPKQGFLICQSIFVDDEQIANKIARDSLSRGATALQFQAKDKFDIQKLVSDIDFENLTIYFRFSFLSEDFIQEVSKYIGTGSVYFQIDILGNAAKTGNWFQKEQGDFDLLKSISEKTQNAICVDASLYQNAGANRTQQLAYALAQTNEYIERFGASIATQIHFIFSVESNYFLEISKLRALRILLDALYKKHGINDHIAHIFCLPSKRNKTLYDYNVNMLRTTTESMSAILGGVDTVSNLAYDAIFHKSNEFGERIARNQLLILQQESYLAEANKLANGAYFIENLTYQLAEKALVIFKQIESGGGFLSQLKKGNIQRKIKESADLELKRYIEKDLILLGSNKLPNQEDQMKGNLDLYPFVKKKKIKTVIPPIIEYRLSEKEEQERLQKE